MRTIIILLIILFYIDDVARAQIDDLNPTTPNQYAHFGWAVALNGDYAVVGSPYEDNEKGADAGAVYIFVKTPTDWVLQKRIVASDGAAGDNFGFSVAISGENVVVGSPFDDTMAGSEIGAAYVFKRTNTNWSQVKKLTANDGAGNDQFGWSVAINGLQIAVGAPAEENNKGSYAGSVYTFNRGSSGWVQNRKLTAGDGEAYDQFGYAVAMTGTVLVVGSPYEDGKGSSAGAFYVFQRGTSGWTQQLKRTVGDGAPYDQLGKAVSISGSFIAVGAPYDDNGKGQDAGAMYVFRHSATGLVQEAKKTSDGGGAFDNFGYSVTVTQNYAAAGSPNWDNRGAVYLFKRVVNSQQVPQWQNLRYFTSGQGNSLFGHSLSMGPKYILQGIPNFYAFQEGIALVTDFLAPALDLPLKSDIPAALSTNNGLEKLNPEVPGGFELHGNYPNPFNPTTTIRFDLPEAATVSVEVVDLLGRLVLQSKNHEFGAGTNQSIQIDASTLTSGTYLYRVTAVTADQLFNRTGRMTLVK